MTSAQVVETSVTNNSTFQNYPHLDDHTIQTINILLLYNLFSDLLFSFASVATSTAYKVKDSVKETVEKQVFV